MLLDEPFGALDALTRIRMHALLGELWKLHQPDRFLGDGTHPPRGAADRETYGLLVDTQQLTEITRGFVAVLARPRIGEPYLLEHEAAELGLSLTNCRRAT